MLSNGIVSGMVMVMMVVVMVDVCEWMWMGYYVGVFDECLWVSVWYLV